MVFIMERIHARHPELRAEDVAHAWEHAIVSAARSDARPFEYLAVGCDTRGRPIEMVGRANENGDWVIWHAFTPPTPKARRELGLE